MYLANKFDIPDHKTLLCRWKQQLKTDRMAGVQLRLTRLLQELSPRLHCRGLFALYLLNDSVLSSSFIELLRIFLAFEEVSDKTSNSISQSY